MGLVYVLHFDKPYHHAKHYIGFVEKDLEKRIALHRKGQSSTLMRVVKKAGIGFVVARVYEDVDRSFERKLKNRGGASRCCTICKEEKLNNK